MSQTTIAKWQKQFLDGARESLARNENAQTASSRREAEQCGPDRGADDRPGRGLRRAASVAKKGGALPTFAELELIRLEGRLSVAGFCARLGIPSSTWYHWRAGELRGRPVRR